MTGARMLIGVALLALVGCSGKEEAKKEAKAEAAVAQIETSNIAAPPGLPVAEESETLKPTVIPPAFEGRWGMTSADCDISRADHKGLLVIQGSTLTFYDASATATVVGGASRYKIVADLALKDGGRKWQRRETLELTNAGTVLLRTEPAPGKTYRYDHC